MIKTTSNAIALPPRPCRRHRRVFVSNPPPVPPSTTTITNLDKKYRARSYTEIKKTRDVVDRLLLYERTFEMCMHADPELTTWIKRMKQKGIPKAMAEGYKPPFLLRKPSIGCTSISSQISPLSPPQNHHLQEPDRKGLGSILLWKASAADGPPSSRALALVSASSLKPCSSPSWFITTSLSRLSSSLSTRRRSSPPAQQHHQHQSPPLFVPIRRSHDTRPKVAIQIQ